jgi:hypothetical protein
LISSCSLALKTSYGFFITGKGLTKFSGEIRGAHFVCRSTIS